MHIRPSYECRVLILGCLCLSLSGCFVAKLIPEETPPPAPVVDDLPDDVPSLLYLSESKVKEQKSIDDLRVAIAALEIVRDKGGVSDKHIAPADLCFRLVEATFLASELEPDISMRLTWVSKGEKAAHRLIEYWPDRVEGYYYLAVFKGRRAEQGGLGGINHVKDIEELALKAAEIAPEFEEGGAYRLLALLYINAPPWPTSIGDLDLALEYAEKAVEVADYPLNHLFLAEVLIEDGDLSRAKEEIQGVLDAPKVGRWARESERWRPHAQELLREIQQQ